MMIKPARKVSAKKLKPAPVNRRDALEFCGFFATSLLSILAFTACKLRTRSKLDLDPGSDATNHANPLYTGSAQSGATPNNSGPPTPSGIETPDSDKCAGQVNVIDWKALADAGENLDPYYKFYGDSTSTLMALSLPKYQHGNLVEIYILRYSGKLLAQKGIDEQADINPDTTLRPVVFDNIQLKGDRKLVFIFKTVCKDCVGGFAFYKYEMPANLTFSDQLFGKKVFSPTPTSVPGGFSTYQGFGLIGPDPDHSDGFNESGPYAIASTQALFASSSLLKDCVITDVVGALISQNGEEFNNIINFPEFLCYRLVDNQYYIRTFIKVV